MTIKTAMKDAQKKVIYWGEKINKIQFQILKKRNIMNENYDIAGAMSSSRAEPGGATALAGVI